MTPFGHIGGGLLVAVTAEKMLFKEEFSAASTGDGHIPEYFAGPGCDHGVFIPELETGGEKARPSRLFYPHANILHLLIDCSLAWYWQTAGDPVFAGYADPPAVRHLANRRWDHVAVAGEQAEVEHLPKQPA